MNASIYHWPSGDDKAPIRSPRDAFGVNVHVVTVDRQGRLALHGPAVHMGWTSNCVALTTSKGALLLTETHRPEGAQHAHNDHGPAPFLVVLDSRHRIQITYGLRVTTGLHPGIRAAVLGAPAEAFAAALPLSRILDRPLNA